MIKLSKHYIKQEKLKAFPVKIGTRQKHPVFPFLNQYGVGSHGYSNNMRKPTKLIQTGRKEMSMPLL